MFWSGRQTIVALLVVMLFGWLAVEGVIATVEWLHAHLRWV